MHLYPLNFWHYKIKLKSQNCFYFENCSPSIQNCYPSCFGTVPEQVILKCMSWRPHSLREEAPFTLQGYHKPGDILSS